MATANVEIIIKTTSKKATQDMKKFTKGFSDGMKKVRDALKSNPELVKQMEDELTD